MAASIPRIIVILALLVPGLAGCSGGDSGAPPPPDLQNADGSPFPEIPRGTDSAAGRLSRSEAALAAGDRKDSLAELQGIPRDGSLISLRAAYLSGTIEESLGQLSAAVSSYEYVLRHNASHFASLARLAEIYALTGQRWEADVYLQRLVRSPDLKFKQLVLLTDFERRHGEDLRLLQQFEVQSPEDPLVQLGLAVEDFFRGQIVSARSRLEKIVADIPDQATAQALLGETLLLEGSADESLEWYRQVPPSLHNHPSIWFVRGLWAQQLEKPQVAARCFWESARQTPGVDQAPLREMQEPASLPISMPAVTIAPDPTARNTSELGAWGKWRAGLCVDRCPGGGAGVR